VLASWTRVGTYYRVGQALGCVTNLGRLSRGSLSIDEGFSFEASQCLCYLVALNVLIKRLYNGI